MTRCRLLNCSKRMTEVARQCQSQPSVTDRTLGWVCPGVDEVRTNIEKFVTMDLQGSGSKDPNVPRRGVLVKLAKPG